MLLILYTIEAEGGNYIVDEKLQRLLESYENPKIIVTNADDSQLVNFGLVGLPYEVFSMKHNPDKPDQIFFKTLLEKYNLLPSDVVYFEHGLEAVISAESGGIKSYHFDHVMRDYQELNKFLKDNL